MYAYMHVCNITTYHNYLNQFLCCVEGKNGGLDLHVASPAGLLSAFKEGPLLHAVSL